MPSDENQKMDATSASEERLEMRVTRGHARLMVFTGLFIIFGAGLLSLIILEPRIPLGPKIPVGLGILYLVWVGISYITGAAKWRRDPLFVITDDKIEIFEEWSEGEIRFEEIERCDIITRRSVERLVIYVTRTTERTTEKKGAEGDQDSPWNKEGWQIPSTVEHYDEAKRIIFARMPERE